LWVAVLTLPVAIAFKFLLPELPFIDRMGVIFLILSAVMILVSIKETKGGKDPKAIETSQSLFKTDSVFNVAAVGILLVLAVLYAAFW
jgi:SSS family solute:Na+ symporter